MLYNIDYSYYEGYLPTPRCRKLRYREVKDTVTVEVTEISSDIAPIAFRVTDHNVMINHTSPEEYRLYSNSLWKKVYYQEKCYNTNGLLPIEELGYYIRGAYDWWNHSKEEIEDSYKKDARNYTIINGIIYEVIGEPRYCVNTFGLGHNHGGTAMFVDTYYNSNISKYRYFNALERDKAISEADRIASARGDTNDVGKFKDGVNIEVLIPEAVHCNPLSEHGDGCSFINEVEDIINNTDNVMEAGLLTMFTALNSTNS